MFDISKIIIGGGDTETTGFLLPDHRLVETYTGLWRNDKRIFEYEQRINPERSMPIDAQRVHGISGADLMHSPTWAKVAAAHAKVISKCDMIVFHNAEFDWGFYQQEFNRVGVKMPDVPVFDTMKEGLWASPDGKRPSLEELCFACEVVYDHTKSHAAAYDVEVMMECFFKGVKWGFFEIPEAVQRSLGGVS